MSSPSSNAPHAVQIVSIGDKEDDYAFELHEDDMMEVLNRAPENMMVSVVSCVGAFRTGKVRVDDSVRVCERERERERVCVPPLNPRPSLSSPSPLSSPGSSVTSV